MIRKICFGMILLLMTGLLCPAFPVAADSLWSDQSGSLYSVKPKNFEVGDLITVLIVEQASASQQQQTQSGEKGSFSAAANGTLQQYLPGFGANWGTDSKGTGSTTRGGTLRATISVQIKEVDPNGIMIIEGRQVIKVNKAEQMIVISGTVRADDVSRDNTVLSTKIANAVIEFQGKGSVNSSDEPGLLTKFLQWLF
ncbi:MAG: flagellar basal body L-ring protein FlgH [Firmicutes bacterium]|nr:flagellar basal body L-ring protein FlgH [Bacillota bacterium]